MQGNYFDIGVNLTHESFNSDYRVVINDAILKNIKKICLTGTSIEDSKKCIEIANDSNLPLFLHQRDAHDTFMECILKEKIKGKAIVHCFTGSINELYDYLDNNLFIGITGWVCDPKRGKNLESIIPEIPINKLLIETDSPYLLPKSLKVKNRRNEPSFLPVIFDKIANLRKESREELKHQIYENSVNFFNLSE